jgi:hypothetical protein
MSPQMLSTVTATNQTPPEKRPFGSCTGGGRNLKRAQRKTAKNDELALSG